MGRTGLAVIVALAAVAPAMGGAAAKEAAATAYQADLGPMPLDDETKAFIAGRGDATAEVVGERLVVKGSFRGMPSRVIAAHLLIGPATGVPGAKVVPLAVDGDGTGSVTGSVPLTRTMRDALRTGRLYIQIDSEKAPPGYSWGPKGTLWGWLLPAHERGLPGVPQQGQWFIPQLDTPSR